MAFKLSGIINIFGISSKLFSGFFKSEPRIPALEGTASTRLTSNPTTSARLNFVNTTQFELTAGAGIIVDNYTDPENPTITYVSWPTRTITATRIAESTFTIITIDSNGDVVQRLATEQFDYENYRTEILIGTVQHFDKVNITGVTRRLFYPNIDMNLSLAEYQREMGGALRGNIVSGVSGGLTLQKTSGTLWNIGSNVFYDLYRPNILSLNALNPMPFTYTWRDGAGAWKTYVSQTLIQPNWYDNNTTGTPSTRPNGTVANNKWSVQRGRIAGNNVIVIEFGQALYNSLAEAIDGLTTEPFSGNPDYANYTQYFFLIVKGGTTDTSVLTNCYVVMSPNVRGGTGASSAITTLNQAYNNGAEPEIQLNSTRGALTLADAATPLVGNLFEIKNNALNADYFSVSATQSKAHNKLAVASATRGTATLVGGTVTVNNANVLTGDLILLSATNVSGTAGHLSYSIVNATSFTITSSSASDTRTVHYLIIGQ